MADPHPTPTFDLLEAGRDSLSRVERVAIRLVRASLVPGLLGWVMALGQRTVGQWWMNGITAPRRAVIGLDRCGDLSGPGSVLIVSNHRTWFDLFVITADLVGRGIGKRIVFPVRAPFFYDHWSGLAVNAAMSFLAMYPPVFRDRGRSPLNLVGLRDLARMLTVGDYLCGMHPEGTRNSGGDPYRLLPARSGVGRLVHESRVRVIPVFINGLPQRMSTLFLHRLRREESPVHVVYGAPVALDDLLAEPGSAPTYQAIAERCLRAVADLGEEERRLRGTGGGA